MSNHVIAAGAANGNLLHALPQAFENYHSLSDKLFAFLSGSASGSKASLESRAAYIETAGAFVVATGVRT